MALRIGGRPWCRVALPRQTPLLLQQQQRCRATQQAAGDAPLAPPPGIDQQRKRGEVFRFRHFVVRQDLCAQRVGTDAMLLGAWAAPAAAAPGSSAPPRVLDVGTGTGVLALMAAQKAPGGTLVDAIDVDAAAVAQAAANAAASRWAAQVRARRASLQEWAAAAADEAPPQPQPYDAIITNPPYFVASSKPEACGRRAAARHADVSLPLPDLAAGCAALLRPGGALHVVLPPVESLAFLRAAAAEGLALEAAARVFTRARDAAPKRVLLRLVRRAGAAAGTAEINSSGDDDSGNDDDDGCGPGGVHAVLRAAARLDALCAAPVEDLVLRAPPEEGGGFTEHYCALTAEFHHPDFFR